MQSSFVDFTSSPEPLRDALLSAKSSSEALHRLYSARKRTDAKYSLTYVCRRAGIPSTGYLSDVMRGKRTLHPKYRAAMPKAFSLKGAAARYLRGLISLDNETDPKRRSRLQTRLTLLKKAMTTQCAPMRDDLVQLFFALEVFCAFGLFRNTPRARDLYRHFSKRPSEEIDRALVTLEGLRLVRREGDRLALLSHQIIFSDDESGLSHLDFLKLALSHSAESIAAWFPRKDQSHFESSILSVKRSRYESLLPTLKNRFLLTRADLESGDADMLIRFNVQIYPA